MEFQQKTSTLDWIVSNVDRDQTASDLGLQCMSQYLGSLRCGILSVINGRDFNNSPKHWTGL